MVNRGFIKVPEGPGLGFTINEEALRKQVRDGGYFQPTPEWDRKEFHQSPTLELAGDRTRDPGVR